ncbi:MAG: hypothetical protein K0S76_4 [Herbinix sp.]|jgi:hypothetical protein|nr:hypothetical protein [Herbinix sp.]
MKETIYERLKSIASAQECMMEVVCIMEQWENSQLILEKSTFDAINISDKALNLSTEGNKLILRLLDNCRKISEHPNKADVEAIATLLEEAGCLFYRILDTAKTANEIAHTLEQEVTDQREIAEVMKNSVTTISSSVNQSVACAEFLLAEL